MNSRQPSIDRRFAIYLMTSVLETCGARLHRGKDQPRFTAAMVAPEKRRRIEALLREGMALARIAACTRSSKNTVSAIRDRLLETEPELMRSHLAKSLQRVANKAADALERTFDSFSEHPAKPSQVPGLAVALGILLDKQAALTASTATEVLLIPSAVSLEELNHRLGLTPFDNSPQPLEITVQPEPAAVSLT